MGVCGARSILFSPKKESARGCLPFPYTKKEDARGVLLSILMKKKLLYIYFISLLGFCVLIASNATAHYPILEDCFIVLFGILGTQAFFLKNFFAFFCRTRKLEAGLPDSEKYACFYGMSGYKKFYKYRGIACPLFGGG